VLCSHLHRGGCTRGLLRGETGLELFIASYQLKTPIFSHLEQ
jgi:hypothetical protein